MNDITAINVLEGLKSKASCRQERVAIQQGIDAIRRISPVFTNVSNNDPRVEFNSDNPYQE